MPTTAEVVSISLQIEDGRKSFYQWDSERYLVTQGLPVGSELHFDMPDTDVPVSLLVADKDGKVVCKVPNELLRHAGTFTVWAR